MHKEFNNQYMLEAIPGKYDIGRGRVMDILSLFDTCFKKEADGY